MLQKALSLLKQLMIMRIFTLFFLSTFLLLTVSSCEKDDPVIPNEEELITTVEYTLISVNNPQDSIVLQYKDIDGDGGSEPTIVGGTLQANTEYTGTLELVNETTDPFTDITEEVLEEGVDHQFFFSSTIMDISFEYNDSDDNDDPIGIESMMITGDPGSGELTIILRHEPDKEADGVSSGDISNAGGETDIEISIPIDIE